MKKDMRDEGWNRSSPSRKIETYEKEEEGESSFHISRSQDRVMHGKPLDSLVASFIIFDDKMKEEKNVGERERERENGCEEKEKNQKKKQDKTKSNHKDADNVTTTTVTKNDKHFYF